MIIDHLHAVIMNALAWGLWLLSYRGRGTLDSVAAHASHARSPKTQRRQFRYYLTYDIIYLCETYES